MRLARLFSTTLIAISVIGGNADAIQFQDGTVYFVHPPRLVETATTFNDVRVWGATYYFTVTLPEDAGEPLQRITINQREGVDDIRYDLHNSFAFEGNRSGKQQRVKLKDATSNQKTRTVSLRFEEPVPPGKTITIALKPWQNPSFEGIYLFGVTAFPTGEKSHGQFLGFGRLHFYSHSFNRFGFPSGW
ncbi:DUF2808 domain-containing protein [Cylindrospermum sp. FACHB-282]|uniref:DUF2808 domain-containing protein n=1 Tax=Cylindrospermum sp. FACHB-282 TaxID=2692794 RepID=UPI001686A79E|nr:DUF2808 domain-containing protein [Cylindrospermum sp. FACHB-282]MBD2383873.1 DUF2808 domain-containing protein [Cylindrospermum sp. FACHB-282]